MDPATTVRKLAELANFMPPAHVNTPLLKAAARYLQEAEDVRAPAAQAVNEIKAIRWKIHAKYPKASVLTILDSVGALLYRIGQTETFEEPFVAAPTTPRQAVAGLTKALQEADGAADRVNKEITAALGDIRDSLDELDEPGPPDVETIGYLTNEGPGIIDRAIAAIDGRPPATRPAEAVNPPPGWVVEKPGARRLTGTAFTMTTDLEFGLLQVNMFLDGSRLDGPFNKVADAEEAVADYINTNRATLVAFGFISKE